LNGRKQLCGSLLHRTISCTHNLVAEKMQRAAVNPTISADMFGMEPIRDNIVARQIQGLEND
jgi:hypothetical protein